jgi:hypothetical protein
MDEPTFDIFRGATKKDAVWIEAVAGFFKRPPAHGRDRGGLARTILCVWPLHPVHFRSDRHPKLRAVVRTTRQKRLSASARMFMPATPRVQRNLLRGPTFSWVSEWTRRQTAVLGAAAQ